MTGPSASPSLTPVMRMTGVTKAFAGVPALRGATLEVRPGEVHGLIGENGAGKSTLIKILAGIVERDGGDIEMDGVPLLRPTAHEVARAGIRFVHQELQLVPTLTVAENVWLGAEHAPRGVLRSRRMRRQVAQVFDEVLGVPIPPGRLVRDLGPAERKLVQIARALIHDDARLIVFDEPTAPLAAAEAEHLLDTIMRLRERGIASLYVSHYLGEVTRVCDRVTVLRGGADVGVLDPVTAESGREMIRLMLGREIEDLYPAPRTEQSTQTLLEARGVSVGADVQHADLDVRSGEILGVTGLLGSGASELAEALVGLRRHTGRLTLRGRRFRPSSTAAALGAGVVLVPRDRRHDGLVLDFTVERNLTLSTLSRDTRAGVIDRDRARRRAAELAERLDIRPRDPGVRARLLSGGNQQKVVIGRSLAAQAELIILDEPTVGVDVGAKEEIYRLLAELAQSGAAVVVVSTDPGEVLGVSDRVVVMRRGRIVHDRSRHDLTLEELSALVTGSETDPRTKEDAA